MTRTTYARIAGFTFLFYIAAGIFSMILHSQATGSGEASARLACVALHTSELGLSILLDLFCNFSALVLAVSLYAITRDENHDLAMMGLVCRVGEGVIGAATLPKTLGLLWLATTGAATMDAATANTLGALFLMPAGSSTISATFFAVGSTIFAYLFLRGRMIPVALSWLGIIASVLLVVILPLQIAGFLKAGWFEWMPMLAFEVTLAFWLMIKGVPAKAG